MFQIDRKEYIKMTETLGELGDVLEEKRETQNLRLRQNGEKFQGTAGAVFGASMSHILQEGVYESAYQQSRKMRESMEDLLPLVSRLLEEEKLLAGQLEADDVIYPGEACAEGVEEIIMLDESRSSFLMQKCEDLVESGRTLRNHMQEAINLCGGMIDCAAEQEALNEAWRSAKRIETFRLAFQKYVMGVRTLDESLRLDFQAFTDLDVVEAGREMKEAANERNAHRQKLAEVKRILGNPPREWSLQETAFLQENQELVKAEGADLHFLMKERIYCSNQYLTEEQMKVNAQYIYFYFHSWGWSDNAIFGIFGNLETESTFNPGKWQVEGNKNMGFGLVQWSRKEGYFAWTEKHGLNPEDIDAQLEYIQLEEFDVINEWQGWRFEYEEDISFKEFVQSDMPETELAKIFMLCYERPDDKSEEHQSKRAEQAKDWKEIFDDIYSMEE